MASTSQLLAFTVTAFVLIAIPGPSVLFTVSRAIVLVAEDDGAARRAGDVLDLYA